MLNCKIRIKKENAESMPGSFEKDTEIHKSKGWIMLKLEISYRLQVSYFLSVYFNVNFGRTFNSQTTIS